MKIDICDLCNQKESNRKFKVKTSKKGYYHHSTDGIFWTNSWSPYEKISICEDCAEKLFGIKPSKNRKK